MEQLSTPTLILKRLANDWKLLLSILAGIAIAASLVAGAPVYVQALKRQGVNTSIDRSSPVLLDLFIFTRHVLLTRSSLERTDGLLGEAIQRNVSQIYEGRERYLKTRSYLTGTPNQPLAQARGQRASLGYFQSISNLEHHVAFIEGRMASDVAAPGPRGPTVEAVIGVKSARGFGLRLGDVLTLTPSLANPTRISAKIVGILEATKPTERYWHGSASLFIDPEPLEEARDPDIEINPEEPPLALFITQEAMVEAVGKAYPGTLVSSTWFAFVDKEALKALSPLESRTRLKALESDLSLAMQGATVFTGIYRMLDNFQRRSFFSGIPLLLLLTIMVITVLYYLSMMVSYLVQSRENDVALLRSRGVSTMQLLRLYALEAAAITAVAVLLAPFVAMGAVAAAGKLPYFREITGGSMLPVEFQWPPFMFAGGVGLLCMAIFVIPALISARAGLVAHKLRSSRPPSLPFFHRYYLDVGLLVLGALVFWELHARGQLVSGGLFKDVQVNEALMLAPVLFLTVVALLFLRFFPLFVRFISGESPALLHLVVAATVVALTPVLAAREVREGNDYAWLIPGALLISLAVAHWLTHRAQHVRPRLWGLALQAGLVAWIVLLEPPLAGDISFVPTISLISIVPAQVVFLLLRALAHRAPVWVSMSLWHMARNPLQYSWLVLLLVMVTGLGILATTVGGTLSRSYEERILYDVAADIRVGGVPGTFVPGRRALKETYLTIPGVTSVSLAFRGAGSVGTTAMGNRFDVLALESQDFPYISWYRDDFSARPLSGVMRSLGSNVRSEPVAIPEGATDIGVWAKPQDTHQNMFLWMVIQDARGVIATVSLGNLGPPRWHLKRTEIPPELEPPLQLASVQIFEPVFGPVGTPGSVLLDDIHVTVGPDGEEQVLDDFEGEVKWSALAASVLSTDSIVATPQDAHRGNRAGVFSFGKDTDRGIRGFYHSPTGGPVATVASASFMDATGLHVGDALIVEVMGRLIPIVIRDTVNYFPTLDPSGGGFLLVDLDSLLRQLNILSPTTTFVPNELFIAEAPGAAESVRDVVFMLAASPHLVRDKESMLDSVRLDPLITAGWRVMVLISVGVILFTAGLGYVTYLLSFAGRSRSEMGFLLALGLSRRQMGWLLGLEHLVIAVVGLGLGTWAGFQMSTLLVSSVAVTETGQPVVPPFILMTDWRIMLPIYGGLAFVFLAALRRLTRGVLRADLQAISRAEGR